MVGEARSVVVRLSLDTAEAIRNSKEFGSEMDRAMGQAERASSRADQAIDKLGSTAGKVALVSAGALVAAGKAAMDWESQFAGVEKTVDGTAQQLAAVEGELREMARTMPATHQEIAATAEAAGQLGVATEDVSAFTRVMVQMGETTNLSADQAATSIAQLMNVMRSEAGAVDNIANTIVDLGNKGASTEAEIVSMAQRVAGAGALIGASEADVLALSAAMANLGIQSELGGGAVQRVLVGINTQVASGGPRLEEYARIAEMSASDFAAAWREDPIAAFDALLQGLGRVQASGGDVATTLKGLGIEGTQNLQVMLRLAGAGDALTTALDQSSAAWEQNSALTEEYGKRAETTGAQAQVALNNIRDAGIEAGDSLLPIIAEISQGVAAAASAFGSLPDPVQSSVTKLLAITAIVGGAAWFGSKAIGAVTSTRDALADLAAISPRAANGLSRVTRAGAGITAVAGAVTLLGNAIAEASGAKLDTSNLARDLQAVATGQSNDVLQRTVDDLKMTASISNQAADYLYEGVTVFGVFGDTALDTAQANLREVDQALASMVESGNGDEARRVFESIVAVMSGLPAGASVSQQAIDDVMGSFSGYDTALGNAATATEEAGQAAGEAAGATGEFASSTGRAGDEAATSAKEIRGLVDAMLEQRDAAVSAFSAETRWRQALVDARKAAAQNNAGIEGNTKAALANRGALEELASAWNGQSAVVRDNEKRFRAARAAFIETAEGMGVSREAARRLAGQLLALPESKVIPVKVEGASVAQQQIAAVRSELASLQSKTITVGVRRVNAGGMGPQVGAYDSGGYTGAGAKYEVAGIVHRSEVVIPAEVVRADSAHLKARYGYLPGMSDLPGYAGGGLVTGRRAETAGYQRLEPATAARPAGSAYAGGGSMSTTALETRLIALEAAQRQQTSALVAALADNGDRVAQATGAPLTIGTRRAAGWGGGA